MVELLAASGELERIRPSPRYRRFMTGTQIEELYRLERAKFLAARAASLVERAAEEKEASAHDDVTVRDQGSAKFHIPKIWECFFARPGISRH